MKLKNYFTMSNKTQYTVKEEFILALIEMNSDSKVSHITRGKLMELSGIKDAETITRMTNLFAKNGDLTKTRHKTQDGRVLVHYNLSKKDKDFVVVYNSLLQFGECAGLAIKMARLRVRGTSEIQMTNQAIISELGMTRPTYIKYRNQLLAKKILFTTDKGFALNTEYFPIFAEIDQDTREHMNNLLSLDCQFIGKKVFLYYYNKNFNGLNCSIKDFVSYCLAGCPGLKMKSYKKPKEFEKIDIKF